MYVQFNLAKYDSVDTYRYLSIFLISKQRQINLHQNNSTSRATFILWICVVTNIRKKSITFGTSNFPRLTVLKYTFHGYHDTVKYIIKFRIDIFFAINFDIIASKWCFCLSSGFVYDLVRCSIPLKKRVQNKISSRSERKWICVDTCYLDGNIYHHFTDENVKQFELNKFRCKI